MPTILVTGASGFVGSHVVPELIAGGHIVRALVRDDEARQAVLRRLPANERQAVEFAGGDVTQRQTLAPAMAGCDAVVHLVAIDRDRSGGRDLLRVNTQGTLNVLAAMEESGVRRLIHVGGLGIREDPRLRFATSKARAERAVAESALDWTILKPSILWGERDGFFNIIAGLARIPVPLLFPIPGGGSARFQPLWVGDLARAIRLCLERPETMRRIYELGGPRIWTYRELAAEVLRAMGKRRLLVPTPRPLVAFAARTAELLRLPFPASSDQIRQLAYDNVGPLTGVRDAFGFEPRGMEGNLGYLRRRKKDQ